MSINFRFISSVKFEKLESLSDDALRVFAEKIGVYLPPEKERTFIIEALLEALLEDSEDRIAAKNAPVHVAEKIFGSSELDAFDASLSSIPFMESRYNETMIKCLVRDTSWAFVYWDIHDGLIESLKEESNNHEFFLRLMEETHDNREASSHFDIPVKQNDLQWYICLPAEGCKYRVDLCCKIKGKVRVLAKSNTVTTPRSSPSIAVVPNSVDDTIRSFFFLSGSDDLDIKMEESHHPSRISSGNDGE